MSNDPATNALNIRRFIYAPTVAELHGSVSWLKYMMASDSAPEEKVTKERYFA